MINKKLLLEVGIFEEFWDVSLDNFKGNKEVLSIVNNYINKLDEMKKMGAGILFIGGSGAGKTMLAIEILKKVLEKGYRGRFCSLKSLLRLFVNNRYNDYEKKEEYMQVLKTTDFLVIDDLGYRFSDMSIDLIEDLIRYRSTRKKVIIGTTQRELKELQGYGDSVYSIMAACMLPVIVKGVDYRKEVLSRKIREKLKGVDV